jgi:organic hydroperoxide reductase OsmC/OhrA
VRDLQIRLENRPGALAEMGEALGKAGVSIEGGGAFVVDGVGVAHFLFEDGAAARRALEAAGIEVIADREVQVQKLDQETPGQLGAVSRRMADAGVNIDVMYSDHAHQLILAVDDATAGARVSQEWSQVRQGRKLRQHHYRPRVRWIGNTGAGTKDYRAYKRDHVIEADGKPSIPGSSDPMFRGDRTRWNPEDMLVASLSTCHQLWYLHLCSDAGIVVTAYEDQAEGLMEEDASGAGQFTRVLLKPTVTVTPGADLALATSLHHKAHSMCFIARSVRFPVECEPTIVIGQPAGA